MLRKAANYVKRAKVNKDPKVKEPVADPKEYTASYINMVADAVEAKIAQLEAASKMAKDDIAIVLAPFEEKENEYHLTGIFIHDGPLAGDGIYRAYVRPVEAGQLGPWRKFSDAVTGHVVDEAHMMKEAIGGPQATCSAYMLSYTKWSDIMASQNNVPREFPFPIKVRSA